MTSFPVQYLGFAVFQENNVNWTDFYTRNLVESVPVGFAKLLFVFLYTQGAKS